MITQRTLEKVGVSLADEIGNAANILTSIVPRYEAWHRLQDRCLEAQLVILKGVTEMVEQQRAVLKKGIRQDVPFKKKK